MGRQRDRPPRVPRSGRCAAASGRSAGRPRSPCRELAHHGARPTAPSRIPRRTHTPFHGGDPARAGAETACVAARPVRRIPTVYLRVRVHFLQAWQSGVGSTPNARPRSVRFASGRADRLSRKASCVPVRPSGGPGVPLRRPSFFSQGELVASPTETSRAPSPLVFPERACRLAACRISWL